MPNYQNAKIYKLISPHTDNIYIGSTIQLLTKRLYNHYKRQSCSSKILTDLGDCKIILIEKYPCDDKMELAKREQHYIDMYSDKCVNMVKAHTGFSNKKEYEHNYHIENSVKRNDYAKKWRVDNAEYIKNYKKEIYKWNSSEFGKLCKLIE